MEVRCYCCGERKDEAEFWNVYTGSNKRQEIWELSQKTLWCINNRNNKQRNCKSCAGSWWNYNKHRREGYNHKYKNKLVEKGVRRLVDLKRVSNAGKGIAECV